MQAIRTIFIGPTNTRGARIKATADAGSIIISWRKTTRSQRAHYVTNAGGQVAWCPDSWLMAHTRMFSLRDVFYRTLAAEYDLLFLQPEYKFTAALAEKMVHDLANGRADKNGTGVKNTCKKLGIKYTYTAIREHLKLRDGILTATDGTLSLYVPTSLPDGTNTDY